MRQISARLDTPGVQAAPELQELAGRAARVNRRQAVAGEVLDEARSLVSELAERFGSAGTPPGSADAEDEILFYRALTDAQAALGANDRRGIRVALQRVQDALAQIVDNQPVRQGRDANEVARWLANALADVSRQRLADALGVDRRTFARWVSEHGTRPVDEDARKLRTMAWTVNLLLRGLTASGTIAWFELPNRELDGQTPKEALERFDAQPRLRRAAYTLLGGDAS